MPELYPLLLMPIFDDRPWGVRDLRPIYTRIVKEPVGESWLTWEDNRVANGPLAGRMLGELCKQYGRDLVGQAACFENRFPLLVKFLFPGDKLSVQVHPDDALARKMGHPCGKTECWYALSARPGAQVALGLKPGVTLKQFEQAIADTRAEELLNWVDVHQGDMLYVAAGTVHTIGGGMVLVETQQTSDITYRLYDYGRGRDLHVAEGLAAIKLHSNAGKVVGRADLQVRVNADKSCVQPASAGASGTSQLVNCADSNALVRSPFFEVEKIRLREAMHTEVTPASPHILVALDGAGVVESPGMEAVSFATGEAVVIPASVRGYTIRPQWELELMRMSLPAGKVAEPETLLGQSVNTP